MADIVYLYPKTSCICENDVKCRKPNGPRSNMSIRGCHFDKCLDLHNRVYIGTRSEPEEKKGWVELNSQVYTSKFDPSFGKVPCKLTQGCNRPAYISQDPRLYSVTLSEYLPLDRPPINGNVKLKNVYSETWDGYGCGYLPYERIRDGQIEYYVDRSIEDAYFNPLYAAPSKAVGVLYKDPMDALKPEYTRMPLTNTENPTTYCRKKNMYGLSFMDDTQSTREDLMSYQMRKRLQERWETRWSQNSEI